MNPGSPSSLAFLLQFSILQNRDNIIDNNQDNRLSSYVKPNTQSKLSQWKMVPAFVVLLPHPPLPLFFWLLDFHAFATNFFHIQMERVKFQNFQNFIHCLPPTILRPSAQRSRPSGFSVKICDTEPPTGVVTSPCPHPPVVCCSPSATLFHGSSSSLFGCSSVSSSTADLMAIFSFWANYSPSRRTAIISSARTEAC